MSPILINVLKNFLVNKITIKKEIYPLGIFKYFKMVLKGKGI
jgi:hypothetical protein